MAAHRLLDQYAEDSPLDVCGFQGRQGSALCVSEMRHDLQIGPLRQHDQVQRVIQSIILILRRAQNVSEAPDRNFRENSGS